MKKSVLVFAVATALFVCIVSAVQFATDQLSADDDTEVKLTNARDLFGGIPTGQAVNWTWSDWMIGGPTCQDKRNLRLSEIPSDVLKGLTDKIDAIMNGYSQKFENKLGFGIGITYNGKTIFDNYYGSISLDSTQKPDENTVISVASNTKIMTSLLLHRLADRGALKLSDPVTKYFNGKNKPAFSAPNPYDSEAGSDAVTLESLAGQVSGLTHDISCRARAECTEEISLNLLSSMPLSRKTYTRPSYSNVGYALLGHCCERAARDFFKNDTLTYEDLMKQELLDVLGMNSSGFNYPEDVKARMATGYAINSDKTFSVDPNFAKPLHWYNPTGGLYSTMKDMLSYETHLLMRDTMLSASGFEGFFLPGVYLDDGVSSYGRAGWECFYANGFRTITKGGLVGGFNTETVLIPELKLGIFGWVNLFSEFAVRFTTDVANLVVPSILEYVEKNPAKAEIPDVMNELLGKYVIAGAEVLSIESDEHSGDTGIYYGNVTGFPVWFVYDKKTSLAYTLEEAHIFRFFIVHEENMDTCLLLPMTGTDDSLAMFIFDKDESAWTVTLADALVTATKE